ncbi:hypothetical protein LPC08_11755 [Roseomonas sp. OT10]|nr:hypothetical protein [Roseomonas sp. OT10]UFN51222.1 hypothetical protein LPC08_11755 [Roseomonas sp. OT10]
MADPFGTPEQRAAFDRRRRGRNWALLAVLLGLVVLFYFVAIARMGITG